MAIVIFSWDFYSVGFDNFLVIEYYVSMRKYFDAHCHLIDADLTANVCAVVNATKIVEWGAVLNQVQANSNLCGAIGVHPWFVGELVDGWDVWLFDLLKSNPDISVGEIGLDKHKPNMDVQIDIFVRQLEIAIELRRGVNLHCVGAWDKMQRLLKVCKADKLPFVLFHRYKGGVDEIEKLSCKYNAFFSYRDVDCKRILCTPVDRVLVETDSGNPAQIVKVESDIIAACGERKFFENATRMLKDG